MKENRGELNLSFGMIFSIILIIIFIAFAFYAIFKFLDYQKKIQIGQVVTYLQEDIDKMWKGSQGYVQKEYVLPSKIDYVCFADFLKSGSGPKANLYHDFQLFSSGGESNMFIYPREAAESYESLILKHISIMNITKEENPYCIENVNGKVKIGIKIDIGDTLVTLSR